MNKLRRLLLVSLIALCSCKVGPNYEAPENAVGDEWTKPADEDPFCLCDAQTDWWSAFNDELLTRYIEDAAQSNQDLLRAEAAICEARALREAAASKLFPQISADLSALKTYFSKNGPVFSFDPGGGQGGGLPSSTTGLPFSVQIPQIQNLFNALFDASWEIDLFGKTRRTVELTEAHIGAVIEERNDLLVSTLAEVARNYMELRSFQKRSGLLSRNIALLEESFAITQKQYSIGTANRLDLQRIEASLESARSSLPDTHAQICRAIYALSVLTGRMPDALVEELLEVRDLPKPPEQVAIGLRSDLLRRRPDVRIAERLLAEATAGVGVAVASFYPTFTLLGDAGLQSLQIKKLFQGNSRTWAYGGDFNLPVFQGGRLVANLKASRAECCMAGFHYQSAVLSALQDAEGALAAYSDDLLSAKQIRKSAERTHEAARLSGLQFGAGLVSRLTFLENERQAVSADLNLLDKETVSLIDLVSLYKALGGGWQSE